jgi:hypothetical protein
MNVSSPTADGSYGNPTVIVFTSTEVINLTGSPEFTLDTPDNGSTFSLSDRRPSLLLPKKAKAQRSLRP